MPSDDKRGTTSMPLLTQEDVRNLLTDPSPASRGRTAAKVAGVFAAGSLGEEERKLAADIFRVMARDAEVMVRRALAQNVKSAPGLPHDVALRLARDVAEVAVPILEESSVLTDEDLIDIIAGADATKQSAVARRPAVSERLAEALIDTGDETVVETLVRNDRAQISERQFGRVIDRFPASEAVQGGLVARTNLPIGVAEKLVAIVSDRLKEQLVLHHRLPGDLATDLILQARERATIGLAGEERDDEELEALARQLKDKGQLSDTILLRAACLGDTRFVEAGLAVLAGIPMANARVLVHDPGQRGLKSLMDKARLPRRLVPVVRIAIEMADANAYDGQPHDRERFARRMIERVLSQIEDMGAELAEDDLDYLIGKLDQLQTQIAA
ncbi:MAG: DUF2336 domain-containing protein [Thalassobaculales bacterium]